jgi:enamine deaminase RidA (YjgF/YER057c/UK114 family)
MFIAQAEDWDEIGRAHGEIFAAIRPASTMVIAALLDPRWRIEIEAEAVLP